MTAAVTGRLASVRDATIALNLLINCSASWSLQPSPTRVRAVCNIAVACRLRSDAGEADDGCCTTATSSNSTVDNTSGEQ